MLHIVGRFYDGSPFFVYYLAGGTIECRQWIPTVGDYLRNVDFLRGFNHGLLVLVDVFPIRLGFHQMDMFVFDWQTGWGFYHSEGFGGPDRPL